MRSVFSVLLLACLPLATAQQPPRSFDHVQLLEEKGETSAGVSIGDLNVDGLPDIVLGKGRHWPLYNRVLINDGRGGFTAANLGEAPDRTYSAALADIDRDGHLDIIVSNDNPDKKKVYRNDGHGRFTDFGAFGQPDWSTRYVTLADLDGDGYPDIVAANRWHGPKAPAQSYVCRNDQKGRFPSCHSLPTESATSIVAADLDGDGALDLFVPHRDGGQSKVLWNDGKGNFPAETKVGPANASIRIGAAGDLDGDGKPDLVYIEERVGTFLIPNRGKRQFGEQVRLSGPERKPYALAVADLNRDNRPDIIVGYVELPGSVYFNTGKPNQFQETTWNDGKGTVYGLAFADLNQDGWPDIVAARSDAPNGIWYSTKPGSISIPVQDGGRLNADLYGEGTKGLVLAHGGRRTRAHWEPQARQFAVAGFRVLAFDFRGYGQSKPGTAGPEAYAMDVLAAVRYLRANGAKTVSVIGASFGGAAAAEAAIQAQPGEIDRLVLLASEIDHAEKLNPRKLFILTRGDTSGAGPRLPRIRKQYKAAPEPKQLVLLDGDAHAQFIFETAQSEPLLRELLRFLTQP